MKKFLVGMMVVLSALAITVSDAEAKRLGGGRSIGRQSSTVTQRQAAPAANAPSSFNQARPAAQVPPAAPLAKPPSPWKGIVGGLIGGAILGGLLSHFGLGGALASGLGSLLTFVLIGLAIYFLFNLFRRKTDSGSAFSPQPAYAAPQADNVYRFDQQQASSSSAAPNVPAAPWGVPADFDVQGFVRNAKTYFIRLQAAWDKADINDIREFTTTEMYAEIKLQIQERGPSPNVTDVVTIDAELLGLETVGGEYVASVKFTGTIKEEPSAPVEPFNEVWNLVKPVSGSGGWVLAGIQQLS